jgi:hypothetical protein
MAVCSLCGVASGSEDDPAPLGWMLEVDARTGRRSVTCPACVRANVRAIEGKLDQAWW